MLREAQIDSLANYLVHGLLARGTLQAKAPAGELVACVVEFLSSNFEFEAKLEQEAERIAEGEARKHPGIDANRLRTMIKQRLAEKANFQL